jgi:hypothetical protein
MPRKKVQPTGAAFGAAASSSSLAGDVSTGAAGAAAADGDVSMTAQQLVGGDGIENYEVAKSHLMKVVRGAVSAAWRVVVMQWWHAASTGRPRVRWPAKRRARPLQSPTQALHGPHGDRTGHGARRRSAVSISHVHH